MDYTVSDDKKVVYVHLGYKTIKCVGIPFNLAVLFTRGNGGKYKFAGITTKGFVRNFLCSKCGDKYDTSE